MSTRTTEPTEPGFYWGRVRAGLIPLGQELEWEPVRLAEHGGRLIVGVIGWERELAVDEIEWGEGLVRDG